MIRSLETLRQVAGALPPTRVAVAAADGEATLAAVLRAAREGWLEAILFGDRPSIERRLRSMGVDAGSTGPDGTRLDVVHEPDGQAAARRAVRTVRTGDAAVLLKGSVSTRELMRAVLDRSTGLRSGRLLSDVFVFDFTATDEPRIVAITDGGVTPAPDLEARAAIIRNAVRALHALDVQTPRVALLSATEIPSPAFPSSLEAAELTRRSRGGEFGRCIVDGPLGLDLALSPKAGAAKGLDSPIAGLADILVFPTLEAANLTAKAVQYSIPVEPGHVIVGGIAPVLIPSRSETPLARLNSLAFGCVMAQAEAIETPA